MLSQSNKKLSWLIYKEMFSSQKGEITIRSWELKGFIQLAIDLVIDNVFIRPTTTFVGPTGIFRHGSSFNNLLKVFNFWSGKDKADNFISSFFITTHCMKLCKTILCKKRQQIEPKKLIHINWFLQSAPVKFKQVQCLSYYT